jgi:hypothetical protein
MNFKNRFFIIVLVCISSTVYVIARGYVSAPSIAMAAPGPEPPPTLVPAQIVPLAVVPGPVVPVAVVPGSEGGAPPPMAGAVPPPIVLPEPPHIISGPSIGVDVVVGVPYDLVVVNGLFYRPWNGFWFRSVSYDGIWVGISGGLIPGVIMTHGWDRIRQFRDREYANYRRDPQHYRGSVRTASPGRGASGGKNTSGHSATGRSSRGGGAAARSALGHSSRGRSAAARSATGRSSRGRSAGMRSATGRNSRGRGAAMRSATGRSSRGSGNRGRTAHVRR